jgi:hypothetical protein
VGRGAHDDVLGPPTFETPTRIITTSLLPKARTITGSCQNASRCRQRSVTLRTPQSYSASPDRLDVSSPCKRSGVGSIKVRARLLEAAQLRIHLSTFLQLLQLFFKIPYPSSHSSLFSMNRNQNQMPNHPVIVSGAIVVISVAVAVSHLFASRIIGLLLT